MSASGYSVNNRLYTKRFYKFFQLWIQVLFFSIGLFFMFGPSLSNPDYFPCLIKAALPVSSKQYWYFSAYVGVFLIAPGLNLVAKYLAEYIGNNKNKKIILFLTIIMICLMWSDPFGFTDGYSFAWLAYLYLIGAMVSVLHIDEDISKAFAVSALIITILTVVLLSHLYGGNLPIDILMERTFPTVLIPSILVVILFSKINIRDRRFCNILIWISSSVFAVYLLHDNRYFRETFISNQFSIEAIGDVNPMLYMFIVTVLIFTVGILLDKIRLLIFNNKLFMRLGSKI